MLEKLARAIAQSGMPFNQKVACLCQAGIECGIFNNTQSELARDHLNFWGLKWRQEMAGFAQPVLYNAHDGQEKYCKFASFKDAAEGYEQFIKRDPYKNYEKYLYRIDSYLTFIGPIFCPPGFTDSWAKKHDGLYYDEYVMLKFGGDAYDLITKIQDEPIADPTRLKILLDPGHSKSDPGALSPNKKVKEYFLNVAQAEHIKKELSEHDVDIYDPNPDNLKDVGSHAKGYDLFISLHHNSYGGTGEPGVEVFTTREAIPMCKRFAASISARIAEALKIPNRGHKEKNYAVINEATKHCAMTVLVESHFVNDEHTPTIALAKSLKASAEIIKAIRVYAESIDKPIDDKYPVWSGIKEFPKGAGIRLAPNFQSSEFDCKCHRCKITKIDYLQLQRLQLLRNKHGMVNIHCHYRCPDHNAETPGSSKYSQHITGRATDFDVVGKTKDEYRDDVFELWQNGGIGTYTWGFHTDTWNKRRW